jgi:hypothetical protein
MLNGWNSLNLFLMSSNRRKGRKMSLQMLCLGVIPCSQLDFKIFGLETIKEQYVHDVDFKDVLLNCEGGKRETNSSSMMVLFLELISYAFQLAPCVCYCCRKHMEEG